MSNLRYPATLARSILYRKAKGKKNRTVIRLFVLITLLMIPLVLSLSFTEGMIEGITKKYVLLQDGHLQIYRSIDSLPSLTDREEVEGADQTIHGYGILYSSDETKEVYLKGVQQTYFNEMREKELNLDAEQELSRTGALPGLYLSRTIADHLKVNIGDRLGLVVLPSAGQKRVRPALGVIQGIFDTGFYALDESLVFIDGESGDRLLPSDDVQTEIIMDSYSDQKANGLISSISEASGEHFQWATYHEFNTEMYENFATSRQIIFAVFLTILVAAVFYITAVTHELIEDAKEEIAMQKILGARSLSIITGYILAITSVTVLALVSGTALGVLLSSQLSSILSFLQSYDFPALRYYLLSFDVDIPYGRILLLTSALLCMSIVSVVFTLRHIIHIRSLDVLQQD